MTATLSSPSAATSKGIASVALTAPEKSLIATMVEVTGRSPHLPFYGLCDQFIYERAKRINEIVQGLNIKGRQSPYSKELTRSYTISLKTFCKQRLQEALSDSFICQFALLKIFSPNQDLDIFQPPFFHEKNLVLRKGITRFKTYESAEGLSACLACHKGIKTVLEPLFDDIKMANRLYAKIALNTADDLELVLPSVAFDESLRAKPFFTSQKQIQQMLLYMTELGINAVEQEHVLIKFPMLEDLGAIARSEVEFTLMSWETLEERLVVFMLYALKQHANFKAQLMLALSGELNYETWCGQQKIPVKSDVTEVLFHSMLNQFVYYTAHSSEMCKELLVHMQPLLVQSFALEGVDYRFEYSEDLHTTLNAHLGVVASCLEDRSYLEIPAEITPYFAPLADDILALTHLYDRFLSFKDFKTMNDLFVSYKGFVEEVDKDHLSYNLVFDYIIIKEQLDQMFAIFEKDLKKLNLLVQKIKTHLMAHPVKASDKPVVAAFTKRLFEKLSTLVQGLGVINRLSNSLFQDVICTPRPFEVSFDLIDLDESFYDAIPVIDEDGAGASAGATAPLLVEPSAAAAATELAARAATAGHGAGHGAEDVEVEAPVVLHDLSSRQMEKILRELGFEAIRCKGSHRIYKHLGLKKTVTLPVGYASIAIGTLNSIFKQAGLR